TGETHIRFYAGAPLAARDGHLLGTLCVMERQPQALTDAQTRALGILSRLVIAIIELRSDLRELRDAMAVRDADEDSADEAGTSLEGLISRLHDTLANLEAAQGRKKKTP